jgi:hypothetical protein
LTRSRHWAGVSSGRRRPALCLRTAGGDVSGDATGDGAPSATAADCGSATSTGAAVVAAAAGGSSASERSAKGRAGLATPLAGGESASLSIVRVPCPPGGVAAVAACAAVRKDEGRVSERRRRPDGAAVPSAGASGRLLWLRGMPSFSVSAEGARSSSDRSGSGTNAGTAAGTDSGTDAGTGSGNGAAAAAILFFFLAIRGATAPTHAAAASSRGTSRR